jgi:sulfonate transport system permease protein
MSEDRAVDHFRRLRGTLLPLALLGAWEYTAHRDSLHAFIFVPLEQVAVSFVTLLGNGELWSNWLASFGRTTSGFALGGATGITLGAVMAVSRWADRLINPLYHAIRQIPLLGWIPLISLWFGNGESSKLFVVALASFYPICLNTYEGLTKVDRRYLAVGAVFTLNRWQTLRHITLPAAMPSIFTGLMQAIAFAWISSVASEFFFNPGPGLGNLMLNGQASFQMQIVFVAVIMISLTGTAMNAVILRTAGRTLRWRSTRQR